MITKDKSELTLELFCLGFVANCYLIVIKFVQILKCVI